MAVERYPTSELYLLEPEQSASRITKRLAGGDEEHRLAEIAVVAVPAVR
jgi:hypothetical protein